jgi:hypothetical protein
MTNHLIIGLGGTGGKIIRAFRKTLFQEFRTHKPDTVNVGYLYVDSSDEMMRIDDPTWKTLGTSVQLDMNSQCLIREANLGTQLDNINNYPGIRNWIGDRATWKTILSGMDVTKAAGGQRRRLGRFLFACRVPKFKELLNLQVSTLQSGGSVAVTFHICTGLAGGTGSGSVIDTIAQIRDLYSDNGTYRILVYALLPETHPKPNWDTGNYHANGYAALVELNALSVGRYQPYDVAGVKGRLNVPDSFNGCYFLTNANENGLAVDVDTDVPNIVADFLYQKIVAANTVSWPSLARIENAENGDSSPETDALGHNKERSKKFLAFGIKRLAIPEDEIREYLAYSFARQAALQLAFNSWSDAQGFLDEPKNQDFGEAVRQRETLQRWRITDEHLTLSLGILPQEIKDPHWKPINQEWADVMPNFKSLVREENDRVWLDELAKMCQQRYDDNYRGLGVRKFYETKLAARKEHAGEIRRVIENELFDNWRNGAASMHDIGRHLVALLTYLGERLSAADDKIDQARQGEELAGQQVAARAREWANIGLIGALIGRRNNLLDAQASSLQEQLTYRTRIESWIFAKALLQELITEINALETEVGRCASMISEAVKDFEDSLGARCGDDVQDPRMQLVRFYDANAVKDFARTLTRDAAEQARQAGAVRAALLQQLGENPTFAAFNNRIPKQRFLDILETNCERSAVEAHNNLVAEDKDRTPLLGVNIVEKLYREYGGSTEQLKKYITELVALAGNYVTFEPLEKSKSAPGIRPGIPTCITKFTVVLPKTPENPRFMATLKEVFQGARDSEVEILETDVKRNEITLVSITNLFPVRFLKAAAFLRDKHDLRVAGPDGTRSRLEIYTEGDGTQFPKIFAASEEEVVAEGLPCVLLGKCMGVIQVSRIASNGARQLLLLTKDEQGLDNPAVPLGASLRESADKLVPEIVETIRDAVEQGLARDFASEDKRAELSKKVVAEVESIKAELDGDVTNPTYQRFLMAGKAAIQLVSQPIP